jgi:hypothetical protein|tara:strand:- start:400 stop:711 length:312 start_codon:yes stop_codon:yes gene_type:complete
MSYHQSLLDAHYNQEDKNECVYQSFEHDVAKELHLLYSHQRQSIEKLKHFIKELQNESWVKNYEMSGESWDYSEYVEEAVEEAIWTCNQWDSINQTNKGAYHG